MTYGGLAAEPLRLSFRSRKPGPAKEPLSAAPFLRVDRDAGSVACQGALPLFVFRRFQNERNGDGVSSPGGARPSWPGTALRAALAVALLHVAGCGPSPAGPSRGPARFEELVAAGKAPVAVAVGTVEGKTAIPTYGSFLRNLCDRRVARVIYTVVFFGPDGKPLPGGVQEVGWNRPHDPIPPGRTWRGSFLSGVADAAALGAVVKEVVVLPPEPSPAPSSAPAAPPAPPSSPSRSAARSALTPPPGSTVWTNPRHDAEVAALLARR